MSKYILMLILITTPCFAATWGENTSTTRTLPNCPAFLDPKSQECANQKKANKNFHERMDEINKAKKKTKPSTPSGGQ